MCVVGSSYQFRWVWSPKVVFGCLPQSFLHPLVLRQCLSLDLELMDLATPIDQQSLRICMYVSCTPDSGMGL